jgi:hypothetical protein
MTDQSESALFHDLHLFVNALGIYIVPDRSS